MCEINSSEHLFCASTFCVNVSTSERISCVQLSTDIAYAIFSSRISRIFSFPTDMFCSSPTTEMADAEQVEFGRISAVLTHFVTSAKDQQQVIHAIDSFAESRSYPKGTL